MAVRKSTKIYGSITKGRAGIVRSDCERYLAVVQGETSPVRFAWFHQLPIWYATGGLCVIVCPPGRVRIRFPALSRLGVLPGKLKAILPRIRSWVDGEAVFQIAAVSLVTQIDSWYTLAERYLTVVGTSDCDRPLT